MRDTHPARPEPAPTWPLTGEQPVARVPRPPRAPRHRHPRFWRAVRALLALLLLILVALSIGYWQLSKTLTNYPGAHFNSGKNAVWLEHAWAGQPHSAAEFDQLAQRLGREQIAYVFAHVGPLESDGAIPADRAPDAGTLATRLHARLPGLKVLAWIGQVEIAGGYPADESVNLADSPVRAGIVHTATHFVKDLGYDGVHYDIEPIVNNNNHFLDLLDETHAALPTGAIVSVSAQKWAPNATVASLIHDIGRADAWWTSFYYAAVAKHADQIVAMLYNTAMPTASAYQLAVKQETANILEAARSPSRPPEVLIGLPTYPGNGFWYHDTAENMRTGLNGVIAGLNSDTETSPFAGVAIYRYALTSDNDWSTYEAMWLGK